MRKYTHNLLQAGTLTGIVSSSTGNVMPQICLCHWRAHLELCIRISAVGEQGGALVYIAVYDQIETLPPKFPSEAIRRPASVSRALGTSRRRNDPGVETIFALREGEIIQHKDHGGWRLNAAATQMHHS